MFLSVLNCHDFITAELPKIETGTFNLDLASVNALLTQASPKLLSAMRGKKISEIVSKRENTK